MSAATLRHRRLRLVVGAPGPGGLEDAFVEEVRRLKERDPLRPVTVLVGSNYLHLHLSRLLAVKLGGHAGLSFLLLADLARHLGAHSLMERGRQRVPEGGRDLLLKAAVEARSHGGSYFREIVSREGFIEALSATIRDLKEARIDPASLRVAGTHLRGGAGHGAASPAEGKLADLADLYEAYDDLLRDRGFYDSEDIMRVAADAAAALAASGRPAETEAAPVLVYGFYDATWHQRLLIREHLSFRHGVVFFPFEAADPDGSWDYALPLLEYFASFIPERIDLRATTRGSGAAVEFLSAPGEAREVVEATRWLVAQARERSFPFGDMALLYRSAGSYRTLISETMAQAGGVPHYLADGSPLSATLPARALRLLLRLREERLPRRLLIEFLSLTSPDGQAARWDRLSREAGVAGGLEDWRNRLDRLAALKRSGDAEAVATLRGRVEVIGAALTALPREATYKALSDAGIDLLRRFVPADPSTASLEGILTSLAGLDAISNVVSLDQFSATLGRAIERSAGRVSPDQEFQRSGIFVGSVMDARLLSFHAVAILGLVEKSFPVAPRQDPVLLDEERAVINRNLGAPRLALKGRRLEEERLLFRLARASAMERLLLSYPRLDPATARPRIASPFLLRMARALEGRHVDYEGLDSLGRMKRVGLSSLGPGEPAAAILPREFDLLAVTAALRQEADPDARRRLATFLGANPILARALQAENARWGETRFTSHDGVILRPNLLDTLRKTVPAGDAISPSHLQSYAACPLAYFMRNVLRLAPLDTPEDEETIDARRRGSIIHQILFRLFTALGQRGLTPLTRQNLDAALAVLDETATGVFTQAEIEGINGYAMLWEVDKERIREDLELMLRTEAETDDGRWLPAHFELRFGMDRHPGDESSGEDGASSSRPVGVEILAGIPLSIKGKIDRVDLSVDGRSARITDYKTGALSHYKQDDLCGGRTVQLPLYMLAVARLLLERMGERFQVDGRYLSVTRKGAFKESGFSAGALDARRADLARVINTFTNGVARGAFFAYPDEEVCRTCDYRLACGEGREARFLRKRADLTAADFIRMREEVK